MKYRLKSKYTQKRLDEISGGDFTRRLQESASEGRPYVSVLFGDLPHFSATFERNEIEEVPALYDPTIWNEWPDAEPPSCELMRVEIFPKGDYLKERITPCSDNHYKRRIMTCARWVDYWRLTDTDEKLDPRRIERLRYKPWEFEE